MLRAIVLETVIPLDGKLPEAFREAFGHKARVVVLLSEHQSEVDRAALHEDDGMVAIATNRRGG